MVAAIVVYIPRFARTRADRQLLMRACVCVCAINCGPHTNFTLEPMARAMMTQWWRQTLNSTKVLFRVCRHQYVTYSNFFCEGVSISFIVILLLVTWCSLNQLQSRNYCRLTRVGYNNQLSHALRDSSWNYGFQGSSDSTISWGGAAPEGNSAIPATEESIISLEAQKKCMG